MTNQPATPEGTAPARRPVLILVTQVLFLLNAIIWVVLGVLSLVRTSGDSGWVLGLVMLGNAVVLGALGWALGTRYRRLAYYLALLVLLVNVTLGVTDQIGLWDMLVLLLNAVMLVLLFVKRPWYTAMQPPEHGQEAG